MRIEPFFEWSRGNSINTAVYPSSQGYGQWSGPGALGTRYRGELSATYEVVPLGHATLGGGYIRDIIENTGQYDRDEAGNLVLSTPPGLQLSADPTDFAKVQFAESLYALFQYAQL